jgi:benzoate 4-monooxygenase
MFSFSTPTNFRYEKLVQELDSNLPIYESKDEIASYDVVKDLPYLNAIISETLRYRPTSSFGLPRLVPEGGATICGEFFKGGTVLSVPSCISSFYIINVRYHSS